MARRIAQVVAGSKSQRPRIGPRDPFQEALGAQRSPSRRTFVKLAGAATGAALFSRGGALGPAPLVPSAFGPTLRQSETGSADYTLRISAGPIEIAPKVIVSAVTYNGKFPGPLLRFKEASQ